MAPNYMLSKHIPLQQGREAFSHGSMSRHKKHPAGYKLARSIYSKHDQASRSLEAVIVLFDNGFVVAFR